MEVSGARRRVIKEDNSDHDDNTCDQCEESGLFVVASGFCQTCSDFLCSVCIKHHKKFRGTKTHALLEDDDMPQQKPTPTDAERCAIHPDRAVEMYCLDEDILGCTLCFSIGHRTCQNVDTISNLSEDVEFSEELTQIQELLKSQETSSNQFIELVKLLNSVNIHCHSKSLENYQTFQSEVMEMLETHRKKVSKRADKMKAKNINKLEKLMDQFLSYEQQMRTCMEDIYEKLHFRECHRDKMFIAIKKNKRQIIETLQKLNRLIPDLFIQEYHFNYNPTFKQWILKESMFKVVTPTPPVSTSQVSTPTPSASTSQVSTLTPPTSTSQVLTPTPLASTYQIVESMLSVDTSQVVTPSASTAKVVTPIASTAKVVTPSASTAEVVTPFSSTAKVVTPTASTAYVVTLSASTAKVVTPSASAAKVVTPSASTAKVVTPSASTAKVVTPSASTAKVVTPSASTAKVVTPSASTAKVVIPSVSTAKVVTPSVSTAKVVTPSASTAKVVIPSVSTAKVVTSLVNVKSLEDNKDCCISGMRSISQTHLLLADFDNKCLKLVDIKRKEINKRLPLTSSPRDITLIPQSQVAVSFPNLEEIKIFTADQNLDFCTSLYVAGRCHGLDCSGDKIVVSFTRPIMVQILDLMGNVLKTIQQDSSDKMLLRVPSYLTIRPDHKRIYISDQNKNTITCIDSEEIVHWVYKDKELVSPNGVAIGESGHLYIGSMKNHTIHVVSPEGVRIAIIPVSQCGVHYPRAVCYSNYGQMLYISSNKQSSQSNLISLLSLRQ